MAVCVIVLIKGVVVNSLIKGVCINVLIKWVIIIINNNNKFIFQSDKKHVRKEIT